MEELDRLYQQQDYSGVSTRELAALIRESEIENMTLFAEMCETSARQMRLITNEEKPFTALAVADRILCVLGMNISLALVIIPIGREAAAWKMAADEFVAKEIDPTAATLEARAFELMELRDQMIDPEAEIC